MTVYVVYKCPHGAAPPYLAAPTAQDDNQHFDHITVFSLSTFRLEQPATNSACIVDCTGTVPEKIKDSIVSLP